MESRAHDNERRIDRGVAAHVGIAKFELVRPDGSVVVSVGISELRLCLARETENGQSQAREEQRFANGLTSPDPVRFAAGPGTPCRESYFIADALNCQIHMT